MKQELTERELLESINDNTKKLLAVFAIQGKDDDKKISMLGSMGYSSFEISELTGIPAPTVRGRRNKSSKNKNR